MSPAGSGGGREVVPSPAGPRSQAGDDGGRLSAPAGSERDETRSDEERIRLLQSDPWVEHPAARRVIDHIRAAVERPQRFGSDLVAVCGPPGNGKSRTVLRLEEEIEGRMSRRAFRDSGVVWVAMPAGARHKHLWTDLCRLLRADAGHLSVERRRGLVHEAFTRSCRRPRLLVVDVAEAMLTGTPRDQATMLWSLKALGEEAEIPVAFVGTFAFGQALAAAEEWRPRFSFCFLPPWRLDARYAALLDAWQRQLPLRRASALTEPHLAAALHAAGGGTIGGLAAVIRNMAFAAIREGDEHIHLGLLRRHGLAGG